MTMLPQLHLAPALVDSGQSSQLADDGKTLSTTFSALDDSLCIYVTPTSIEKPKKEEYPTYFAGTSLAPSSERRLFVTDTYLIFSGVRHLEKQAQAHPSDWITSKPGIELLRKLAFDYINFVKECWIHASKPLSQVDGPPQLTADHYRSLYTIFSLFVLLYLPQPDYENAPVGDDLMEWLNTHFIEPSTEEGDQLSALERPWEDDAFWPYVTRSTLRGLTKAVTFFLDALAAHPIPELRHIAETLGPIIISQPRLGDFDKERDYAMACRRWREKVKALRVDLDRVPEDSRQGDEDDEFEGWWERVNDIVGILEGRQEILVRVCKDIGADWKEICCAWGIFVDNRLRRQDLPDVFSAISEELDVESDNQEDLVHQHLFSGEPMKVLERCAELDPWLSAHLADIMTTSQLVENELNTDSELKLRDYYILDFAQYLRSDPGLWRMAVSYMYTCGHIGERMADQVLVRVPLRLQDPSSNLALQGSIVGVLQEINQVCYEHGREETRRAVCRSAAQMLVREKRYGLAVSYCTSAEDWAGLGLIVDRVLNEYFISGPEKFTEYASTIAPSLQHPTDDTQAAQGIFLHRLNFATRYSRFHRMKSEMAWVDASQDLVSMLRDDLCPKSWWSVLLYEVLDLVNRSDLPFSNKDVSLLLQKLQEVTTRSAQGSGDDYLQVFMRAQQLRTHSDALLKLDSVRFCLAKYYARCSIVDVGGKSTFSQVGTRQIVF